jgi:hypothetical protein
MHHAGLAGLIEHERARTPTEVAARTAQNAPLGFDVAFQELFSTWASGGTLVPVPREIRRDPVALARFLDDHAVTRIHLSPLVLRALAAACSDGFPSALVEIVAAGEALRIDEAIRRAAQRSAVGVRIVNQYGPTETHVATSATLSDDPESWPDLPSIGAPVDGVVIRIEDADGGLVPWGGSGELVVEDLRVYTIGTNVNQSAVVLSEGSVILRRCAIGSGSPVAGGQGIASSPGTFLDIQDCEFLYCKDIHGYQRRGGGLRIGGDAVVSSSVFIGCESNYTGGAIYCGSNSLAISDSSFMNNYAPMGSVVYGTGFSFEQSAACGTSNWFGGSGWVDLGGNCFVADCQDCNENARADLCDILMGVELDINFDSIPDGCQCVTDLNEDGRTDAGDVGVLLAFWGPVAAFPAADINSDGRVDSADLGLVLGYLGDCR